MPKKMHGWYYDPLHGGCLRRIRRTGRRGVYRIVGVYGDDEAPHTGRAWTATVYRAGDDDHLRVDFSGKPTKAERVMSARLTPRAIHWSDGNIWTRLYAHSSQMH
jgi:hypothetical protein